jgi:hypothetical protein
MREGAGAEERSEVQVQAGYRLGCLLKKSGNQAQRSRKQWSETQLICQAIRSGGSRIGVATLTRTNRVVVNWT